MSIKVEMKIVCGNTHIESQVKHREHLNDLLFDNGIDYINRPNNWIEIIIDDAFNASKLSAVVKWLQNASN